MSLQSLNEKVAPKVLERLWDLFCIATVIGIWPRFIEPKLLLTSFHRIAIPTLPIEFDGLRIVQICDLHYSSYISEKFLDRIVKKVQQLSPDILVFTGDLLSYAELAQEDLLHTFLTRLSAAAPLGSFAIFGNHDYSDYVSYSEDGVCRPIHDHVPTLLRGFTRLLSPKLLSPLLPPQEAIAPSEALIRLYESSGFVVLHNETVQIGRGMKQINITGVGDLMTGHLNPKKAYSSHNAIFPTLLLSHNPDSYEELKKYPAELMLFGHTHGGQVNLPFLWKRVTPLKDHSLKSGLILRNGHKLYINRGLGSTFPFRWFAPPEIALFELTRASLETVADRNLLLATDEGLEPALRPMRESDV